MDYEQGRVTTSWSFYVNDCCAGKCSTINVSRTAFGYVIARRNFSKIEPSRGSADLLYNEPERGISFEIKGTALDSLLRRSSGSTELLRLLRHGPLMFKGQGSLWRFVIGTFQDGCRVLRSVLCEVLNLRLCYRVLLYYCMTVVN